MLWLGLELGSGLEIEVALGRGLVLGMDAGVGLVLGSHNTVSFGVMISIRVMVGDWVRNRVRIQVGVRVMGSGSS